MSTRVLRMLCFRAGGRAHRSSQLKELVVSDSIPLSEAAQAEPKIRVRSIAGLLGAAIESIHMETSVSTLFG